MAISYKIEFFEIWRFLTKILFFNNINVFIQYNVYSMSIIDQNDKLGQKVKFDLILPKWQNLTKSNFLKSGHF